MELWEEGKTFDDPFEESTLDPSQLLSTGTIFPPPSPILVFGPYPTGNQRDTGN